MRNHNRDTMRPFLDSGLGEITDQIRNPPGMVKVSMGEYNIVEIQQVDAQALGVADEEVRIATVKEDF